jgi:hypothetical protein
MCRSKRSRTATSRYRSQADEARFSRVGLVADVTLPSVCRPEMAGACVSTAFGPCEPSQGGSRRPQSWYWTSTARDRPVSTDFSDPARCGVGVNMFPGRRWACLLSDIAGEELAVDREANVLAYVGNEPTAGIKVLAA